ncbi:hypothetical protein JCM16814_02140 [Desulfobaculum senezii]
MRTWWHEWGGSCEWGCFGYVACRKEGEKEEGDDLCSAGQRAVGPLESHLRTGRVRVDDTAVTPVWLASEWMGIFWRAPALWMGGEDPCCMWDEACVEYGGTAGLKIVFYPSRTCIFRGGFRP